MKIKQFKELSLMLQLADHSNNETLPLLYPLDNVSYTPMHSIAQKVINRVAVEDFYKDYYIWQAYNGCPHI